MPFFERFLSVWVGLAIVAGVALGLAVPGLFQAVAAFEVAHVNLAVAVFIWVMIYPMMIQIDFAAMKRVGDKPKGLLLTLVVNWLIKPFTMAALGWLFFKVLFADMVDPQTGSEYIAGMILLGRGALHRHGVRVEPPHQGRRQLHPGAGVGERRHHGVRLRPHRRAAAGRQ